MKRVFRISDIGAAISELRGSFTPKFPTNPTTIPTTTRWVSTESSSSKAISNLYGQFADRWAYNDVRAKEEMTENVSSYRDELIKNVKDENSFENLLDVQGWNLFKMYSDGAAFVELLRLLESSPHLALKALNWRRKKDQMGPMSPEEYAKGIKIAGRIKDVDLAVELFKEATNKRCKNTSTYNALMGAYMYNGLSEKCQSVYRDLKQDANCRPTSATFNMLISIFGHRVLIDQMETVFQEMKDYDIAPDLTTYNNLISGYLTAWMWDSMEATYRMMETGPVRANLDLRLLMLRGYAHSEEDLVDQMDKSIDEAFDHNTTVNTVRIMRAISSTYIRNNAVDKLARFISRAGHSGWRMCRGLYHELMWVLASQKRIEEMEQVLVEMEKFNYGCSKRTFIILYKAYSEHEQRYRPKLYRVLGLMFKYGYGSIVTDIRI